MTKLRLYYLDICVRADGIRKLLHYKKVPFEEVTVGTEQTPELKKVFKHGPVPALEVDGKFLFQSNAIVRYLARQYDLEGKGAWEMAKVDEINELLNEFNESISEYMKVCFGLIPGDRDKVRTDVFLPNWQKYGPQFEEALKEAGSGFYAKSGLTYLDFIFSLGESCMVTNEPELVKDMPLYVEHGKRVNALPELQEYLKSPDDN